MSFPNTALKRIPAAGLLALAAFTCLAVAVLFLPKMLVAMAIATLLVSAAVIYTAAMAINSKVDSFLVGWVFLFPLGYYFLTLPKERSIVTLDRVMIVLLVVAMAFGPKASKALPAPMRIAGIAWSIFLIASFTSLRNMENPIGASKEVMDGFLFPAILACYVLRNFDVRSNLRVLHLMTCLMCFYVAAIGIAELVSGHDLLPLPAGIFIAAETGTFFRVNGPFATNNSFVLIGTISLFFLIFLRRAMGQSLSASQRTLHSLGLVGASVIALIPMFRSVMVTLLAIVLIELYMNKRANGKLIAVAVGIAGVVALLSLKAMNPYLFDARVSDPSDVYARIAQSQQTMALFWSHPFNGVGLANYANAAEKSPQTYYHGVGSVGSAHNTLASILADTGITGFSAYLVTQIYFLKAFWQLRRRGTREALLSFTMFFYVFLSYWLTGLMFTSGYYSDLNLWFLFVTACIYKFGWTERLPNLQANWSWSSTPWRHFAKYAEPING